MWINIWAGMSGQKGVFYFFFSSAVVLEDVGFVCLGVFTYFRVSLSLSLFASTLNLQHPDSPNVLGASVWRDEE